MRQHGEDFSTEKWVRGESSVKQPREGGTFDIPSCSARRSGVMPSGPQASTHCFFA